MWEILQYFIGEYCVCYQDNRFLITVFFKNRLGEVPVQEASVVIAISSTHRKEVLEALPYAIDTLKAEVPVWKKEVYAEEPAIWKENTECVWSSKK